MLFAGLLVFLVLQQLFVQVLGLQHIQGFLSWAQQQQLLALMDLEGFFSTGNQVMLFGRQNIPEWCHALAARMPIHLFPSEVCSNNMCCATQTNSAMYDSFSRVHQLCICR
jgi:hypothetical protein